MNNIASDQVPVKYDEFLKAKAIRHICPLQLQVIERALKLWSNPGDLVLSPFTGIGSEGYVAVKMGRRFVGAEIKASYFKQSCANLRLAEQTTSGDGLLFDESEVA